MLSGGDQPQRFDCGRPMTELYNIIGAIICLLSSMMQRLQANGPDGRLPRLKLNKSHEKLQEIMDALYKGANTSSKKISDKT